MDVVDLPILPINESPRLAVDAMRRYERSAVLVRSGPQFEVAGIGAIYQARSQDAPSLGYVKNRSGVYVPPVEQLASFAVSLADPRSTWLAYETILDKANLLVGLLAASDSVALVFTRHEEDKKRLGGRPSNCHCSDCDLPAPGRAPGDSCVACGGIIFCST